MNRYILFLISFLLISSDLLPQKHIIFNHLTIKEGLSQSSVTCILQDSKGFMWFGTQDGLNRFDGYNFRTFKNDPSEKGSLSDNFIFTLYENTEGMLYVETQSGQLHQYLPYSESFMMKNKDSVNLKNAKISTVGARLLEPGIEWSGGLGKETGLKRLDLKTGKSTTFKHEPNDPWSISDNKVYSIFRDVSGNLWIGTFNGLNRFEEKTGRFIKYKNNPADPNSIADNWIWPIYQDSKGNLWVGTVRAGLCRFDPNSNTFINYRNNPTDPTSLSDNFVFSIYEDKSGVLWVGTNLGGINYFHPSTEAFDHYKNEPGSKNSLSDNVVTSILADKNGEYWIGTRNGLNKFNYRNKTFTQIYDRQSAKKSSIRNSVQSLFQDRNGIIWIGSFTSGLDAFNTATTTFTHYENNRSDTTSLSDNRIYAITEDKIGNIWIGTYGSGVNKLDRRTGKFLRYQFKENEQNSLSSNATWSIGFDDAGDLWIGTFGGGINIFNTTQQKFRYYKHVPDNPKSIADDNIIRVFKDHKGNMWIGTAKGLSRYNRGSGTFKNYSEKDGLCNNFVYGIVEDKSGNLWLSTNNGLSRFNPVSETFKNFYYENGLQGNEFNQNAYAQDRITGQILFGGPNGFNIFHPDDVKDNTFIPPVIFSGYLRYNTDDQEGKPIYEKGITERDSIYLTYKDNIISLDFSALSFYNNYQNQYKYKLVGFNKNWIQLGNKHNVTFTNLAPGEYSLKVIGSNNDGIWNQTGSSLYIKVTPPWWKTKVAYTAYGLFFLSVLYGIRKFETDRKEQKAKIRETELRIKATEAEKRAIQIEHDRKTKELEEARQLQLSMLPKELPQLANVEIAAFMRTATEVGGDYYDFIVGKDGTLNVAFGDATGHGLQAGTMVTLMKGFFTSDAARFEQQEFMNHCSNMIREIKLGRILMSFTFLKFIDGCMKITSAGMPPVYYHNSTKDETEEIVIKGMPLGAMKKFPYTLYEKEIFSGDTVLLLSDGLPEQMNKNEEMFDYTRVKKLFSEISCLPPKQIIEALVESGDKWMDGALQMDDISFVVLKVK